MDEVNNGRDETTDPKIPGPSHSSLNNVPLEKQRECSPGIDGGINRQNVYNILHVAPVQYEYLDHTADVQLHTWGGTMEEALAQMVIALYGYMTTEIERVKPVYTMDFSATGHDVQALVFNLLDNCLYNFCAEPFFIGCIAKVLRLNRPAGNISSNEQSVHVRVWGESFDPEKHPPGTEIKAITYSNMQIMQRNGEGEDSPNGGPRTDIFVIVDI